MMTEQEAQLICKTRNAQLMTNYGNPEYEIYTLDGILTRGVWQEREKLRLMQQRLKAFRARNEFGETALYVIKEGKNGAK